MPCQIDDPKLSECRPSPCMEADDVHFYIDPTPRGVTGNDAQWSPSKTPMGNPFEATRGKSARISFSQPWIANKIELKADLLDTVKDAAKIASDLVVKLVGQIETVNISPAVQSLVDAIQTLRNKLANDFREYDVNWECRFASDSTMEVYVKNTITPRVSIDLKGKDTKQDRMKWKVKVTLSLNKAKCAQDVYHHGSQPTGPNPINAFPSVHGIGTADQGGHNVLQSNCQIRIDFDGWLDDANVKAALTKIDQQVTELKNIITNKDQSLIQITIDAAKKVVKDAIDDLWNGLGPLLASWNGQVSIDQSDILVFAPTDDWLSRCRDKLNECIKNDLEARERAAEELRSNLIKAFPRMRLFGTELFPLSMWEDMGLSPDHYQFEIVKVYHDEGLAEPAPGFAVPPHQSLPQE